MEKYLALARDAAGQGDRVLSENYLQHAEHYFRIIQNMQPRPPRVLSPAAADGADGSVPMEERQSNGDAGGGNESSDDDSGENEPEAEVIRPAPPAPAEEAEEPESVAV